MRTMMAVTLAGAMAVGITSMAQPVLATSATAQAEKAPPLMTIRGTIKAEGGKYMFVNDKDMKSWEIVNSEAVKGHEGHHVTLKAHVYADKNQIHVMDVKMMKAKKASKKNS